MNGNDAYIQSTLAKPCYSEYIRLNCLNTFQLAKKNRLLYDSNNSIKLLFAILSSSSLNEQTQMCPHFMCVEVKAKLSSKLLSASTKNKLWKKQHIPPFRLVLTCF